ncbi:MAG: shikimate kinase [Planctomycetes bacterium]|nr:shikimate kinase [Planctomycetota bacterium]
MSNIVLIGFRCSGKTTVGRYLGTRLKMEFVDSDELIELRSRNNIRQIFETKGESWFRDREAEVLLELSKRDNLVIASGGGCVLRYKTIRELKRNARVVLLEATVETLHRRIKEDPRSATTRPALTSMSLFDEINSQLELRRPYYEQAAEVRVVTESRPIDDIAEDIITQLGLRNITNPPPRPHPENDR